MDNKLISQLTDDEKQQLKDLKRQLDDGTISQKDHNKKHKELTRKIQLNHSPWFVRNLGKVIGIGFALLLLTGFLIQSLDPQKDALSVEITDVKAYSIVDFVVSTKVSNSSSQAIDATCTISLVPTSEGAIADAKKDFTVNNIQANSSKKAQVAVKIVQNNTAYKVDKDSEVTCRKAY